jgi:glycerol-3-phosphate dehydrogenase (NAD(P)+)
MLSGKTLVIGDGGWGQAIAMALHNAGRDVAVWGFDADYCRKVASSRDNSMYLAGVHIPEEIVWTGDADEAVDGAVECYSVVPTQFLRPTLERFGPRLSNIPLVSASKGLEISTLLRPTEILAEFTGADDITVLSGPSHAEEVSRGLATTVVAAAQNQELAENCQQRIASEHFRVYTSSDPVGVELGGALKNIIAVGAGVADGLGLGDNAKAALVSRGLIEMARFGESYGAKRETFFGLSGAGDLMVTCYSQHSRNRSLGNRIGNGESLDEILASTQKVAEGVWTTKAIHKAARERNIEMPITEALYGILFDNADVGAAVRELMSRPSKPELDATQAVHANE